MFSSTLVTIAAASAALSGDPMVLDHEATLSDGSTVRLDEAYAGKVVLIVNTASRCGFTRQYEGLQELHETYRDDGLVVLAFPCNDFGGQEPGTVDEIVEFCSTTYAVDFPIFDKVRVLGDEAHPLYLDLRSQPDPIGGPPKWNFTKFLLSRDGAVISRFEPTDEPMGDDIREAVEAALGTAAPDSGG